VCVCCCVTLPCLALPCLALSCLVLPCLVLTFFFYILCRLVLCYVLFPCLVLCRLVSSCLILSSEPDSDGDVILRAGYLLHKSSSRRPSIGLIGSGWKPRYTVLLSTGTILCFKQADDLAPCQVLHLVPGMTAERRVTAPARSHSKSIGTSTASPSSSSGHKFVGASFSKSMHAIGFAKTNSDPTAPPKVEEVVLIFCFVCFPFLLCCNFSSVVF
jgi:hypothetical protein